MPGLNDRSAQHPPESGLPQASTEHLHTFEEALVNLEAATGDAPSTVHQLEIHAVEAKIEDLRIDVEVRQPHCAGPAPDRRSATTTYHGSVARAGVGTAP